MSFVYSLILKLLYPTSVALALLIASAVLRGQKRLSRGCFWLAICILMICGNGWLAGIMTQHLEWQYRPPDPVPQADCIVVLSGGILPRIRPRPSLEVADAGDRVLYAAQLFRANKAPRVICAGNVATGGVALRPASEDMAEFLGTIGVPKEVVIKETESTNTHEHARNLYPLLRERGCKRVLLVTSAMHMPRSVGVFRKLCPGIEFIPAPTDYRITERVPSPWYHELKALIPTPSSLLQFSEAMHEYLGIAYYRLKSWM